jgi:hypothetical protein
MVALRGTATSATAASGTSVAANKPTGTVQGDLLLAVFTNNNQTVTRPSGWSQLFYVNANATTGDVWSTGVYYKVAGASEGASYTFSVPSAAPLALSLSAWSGVDTTTPIGTNFAQTISGSHAEPYTTPTATVGVTDGRMVYVRAVRIGGTTAPAFSASGVDEVADVSIFSGGTVCYGNSQYTDTADFTTSGSKAGIGITCSQTESDNLVATIALKAAATPVSGNFVGMLPAVSGVDFEGGPHDDATVGVTLGKVSCLFAAAGEPAASEGVLGAALPVLRFGGSGTAAATGSMNVTVLPLVAFQVETRVFGIRVISVELDDSRRIIVPSRGVDD